MPLTDTGFVVQTLDEIKTEIETDLKDALGPNLDVSATSVVGQFVGIFAEREHELQQLSQDVWSAGTPGGANGVSLTELALITGTIREDATYSTVLASVTLNAGVTLPAGSRANVEGDAEAVFETVTDVTNSGGSPATLDAEMLATEPGAVRANAGTLTEINTPVTGWTAVGNVADADMGEEDETDPELRIRREQELRIQGSSNIDAIAADVATLENVRAVEPFENDTDSVDGDGLPKHSFEIVVWDGDPAEADDDEIAQAIWNSKPVGIQSFGSESGTAVDRQGSDRIVNFSRATQKDVWLEFDLTVNDQYPVDGDTQVQNAIVDFAEANWSIGSDVILSALYTPVNSISGVVSINAVRAGFTTNPVGTANLTIAAREIALADTARIEVNS